MSEILAIEWDSAGVHAIAGSAAGSKIRISKIFSARWPAEISPQAQPQPAGQWLKEQLAQAGITATAAKLSLPREEAVVRHVQLPNVPDEELPELARLQAATLSSVPMDQLVVDFVPSPALIAGDAGRGVLLVTMSTRAVERQRALLQAAGLELTALGVSAFGLAEFAARAAKASSGRADRAELAIGVSGRRVEIAFLKSDGLIASHSAQRHGQNGQDSTGAILTEVSRASLAFHEILGDAGFSRAWTVTDNGLRDYLPGALSQKFDCTVATVDPWALSGAQLDGVSRPDESVGFVGPLAMLLPEGQRLLPAIDLVNPRKPALRKDRRKLSAGLIGAAAAVAIVGGIVGMKTWTSRLDGQIKKLNAQIAEVDMELKAGAPTVDYATKVKNWRERNVEWLDRLAKLNRALPPGDKLYFTELTVNPAAGDSVTRIQAKGFANTDNDVRVLGGELKKRRYIVLPYTEIVMRKEQKDPQFPWQFTLDVEMTADTLAYADEPAPTAAATPPAVTPGVAAPPVDRSKPATAPKPDDPNPPYTKPGQPAAPTGTPSATPPVAGGAASTSTPTAPADPSAKPAETPAAPQTTAAPAAPNVIQTTPSGAVEATSFPAASGEAVIEASPSAATSDAK